MYQSLPSWSDFFSASVLDNSTAFKIVRHPAKNPKIINKIIQIGDVANHRSNQYPIRSPVSIFAIKSVPRRKYIVIPFRKNHNLDILGEFAKVLCLIIYFMILKTLRTRAFICFKEACDLSFIMRAIFLIHIIFDHSTLICKRKTHAPYI